MHGKNHPDVHDSLFTQEFAYEDAATATDENTDDDPQCVCGVYRSEHRMLGCPEGFQTAESWDQEREFIRSLDDDTYDRIYHGDEY